MYVHYNYIKVITYFIETNVSSMILLNIWADI